MRKLEYLTKKKTPRYIKSYPLAYLDFMSGFLTLVIMCD